MQVQVKFLPQDQREVDMLALLRVARPDIQHVDGRSEFAGELKEAEKIVHAVTKLDAVSTRIKRCYEATQVKPFTESNRER